MVLGAVAGGACELEEFAADDVGIGSCGGEGLSATALRASRASIRSRSRWRSRSPSSMRCESVATISSSAVRRLFRPNSIPGSGRTKTSRPRTRRGCPKNYEKACLPVSLQKCWCEQPQLVCVRPTCDMEEDDTRGRSWAFTAAWSAVAAGGVLNAVLAYSFVSAWFRKGAPFVPSAATKIQAIFGAGGLLERVCCSQQRRSAHLVDLGSGGGTLVRAAVRQGGFGRATGIEINPALVAFSKMRSIFNLPSERFRLQCMWTADVSDADVIFVYGVPSILGRLGEKLVDELPEGAHVVSNSFPFTQTRGLVELDRRWVEAGLKDMSADDSSAVFLYRVDKGAARDV